MSQKPQRKLNPLDAVRWVDPATLYANDYNPNHVFGPELALLKCSILEDGWTQPIVIQPDGQIVDGFHRWSLAVRDEEVRAQGLGFVPVVTLNERSKSDQVFSTVRHNRARGQHGLLAMSEIVRGLVERGMPGPEIMLRMGLDSEELRRLTDMRGTSATVGKDSYGRGWVPKIVPATEALRIKAEREAAREAQRANKNTDPELVDLDEEDTDAELDEAYSE